jgi:hypothetical protein
MTDLSHLSSNELQELANEQSNPRTIPVIRIFLAHYSTYPCWIEQRNVLQGSVFHLSSILTYLADRFGHDTNNDITKQIYDRKAKTFYVQYEYSLLVYELV